MYKDKHLEITEEGNLARIKFEGRDDELPLNTLTMRIIKHILKEKENAGK